MNNVFSLRALLGLGIAAATLAAGPAMADPSGDWSGTYVGGFLGGNMTDFKRDAGSDSSFLGGVDVGHNWQRDHMIIGLEGDFSKFNTHVGNGGTKFTEDWMGTARARAGYSLDRFMPYVTGGLAMTDTVYKVSGAGLDEEIAPGFTAGGGVDAHIAGNWFGRVEYLYTDVPSNATTIGNTRVNGGSGDHALRFGVNYKF